MSQIPRPRRALVVDDSFAVRRYHAAVLGQAGLAADLAEDGAAGLEQALARSYDAFLIDVNMPRMDGYTLVRQLREHGITAPILMVSTESGRDRELALAAGADAYLLKPLSYEALVGCLGSTASEPGGQSTE